MHNIFSKLERAASPLALAILVSLATTVHGAVPMPVGATYQKGVSFTVDGYAGSVPLVNFPVLVRLNEGSPEGFSYNDVTNAAATDKADIDLCFVDGVGVGLPFEIDTWNPGGESLVWVRLPSMSQGTTFNMCWGSVTPGTNVCNASPWSDYTGVWHMSETNDAITTIHDSTTNHLDGTTVESSSSKMDGKVGRARFITSNTINTAGHPYDSGVTIDMTGDAVKLSAVDALVPEFTASFWVRPQNNAQWWYFITRKASDMGPGWGLQNGSSGNNSSFKVFRAYGGTEGDTECMNLEGITALEKQKWVKLDAVWMANKTFKLYVNGVEAGAGTLVNQATNGDQTKLALGGAMAPTSSSSKNGRGVYGDMDEIRLRKGAMTDEWIAADCATVTNETFLTAGTVEAPAAATGPLASLGVSSVAYTNATLAVTVASLGAGVTSMDVAVEISQSSDFSIAPRTNSVTVMATGISNVSFVGLVPGTTYYARAILDDHEHAVVTTDAVSFMAQMPGAPTGTMTLYKRGFTTLAATGVTADFGTGGESAVMRLEASTNGFETVAAFSQETDAAIGDPELLVVENLAPDTVYTLRLRIVNDWGVATFVTIADVSTIDVPFVATGIGYSFSPDFSAVSLSFVVNDVFDGAECSASWALGGSPIGTTAFVSPGTFSSGAQAVPTSMTVATVVVVASVGGKTYEKAWTTTVRPGRQSTTIDDIDDHITAATAVRLHVGDTMTLPQLDEPDFYEVGNHLFVSVDGTTATALRPGVVGIHQRIPDDVGGTNVTIRTLNVIVLPDPIPGGAIYILDETKYSGTWGHWTDPNGWEKLGSETRDSYPCNPGDIAIVPLCDVSTIQIDPQDADIAIGALYVGGFKDVTAYNLSFRCQSNKHSIAFERMDGGKALLQLCSSATYLGNNQYRTWVKFQDTIPLVWCLVNTVFSGGFDGTSSTTRHGRIEWNAVTEIPEGVTLELVEFDTQGQDMGGTMYVGKLSGGGVFWNHSSAMLRVDSKQDAFTGTWRDSGGHGADGQGQGRSAPIFFRTATVTNSFAETIGWVHHDGVNPTTSYNRGVGAICTGWPHTYNPKGPHLPWFPARGLQMHGGLVWNRVECSGSWTNDITRDVRYTDKLTIGGGFNFIVSDGSASYPAVVFESAAVAHEGTASLRLDSVSAMTENAVENQITTLHGIGAFLEGGGEDPEISNAYSMSPWIISKLSRWNNEDKLCFAAFDTNGRHVAPKARASGALATWGEEDNAYVSGSGVALEADWAIRSLALSNSSNEKTLGIGRTLTVKSGGIIFPSNDSAIGIENGGTANGFLVLGDANHPAYVWARGSTNSPNQIWAKVTALGGFVAAYTGNLVLGGDQRGIAGEIAVNAGSLQLGTAASNCQLVRDLPIRIFANATLRLPNAESTKGAILKFDGAAGWFGKVEIPDGVAAKCWKAYWRDYPETQEWQNLKRGVYTGDAATALANPKLIYDPEHFSGEGTIEVLRDDLALPLVIRVK